VSGLSIKDGAEVKCGGRRFIIMQLIGFSRLCRCSRHRDRRLDVVDLNPVSPAPSPVPSLPDLNKVDDRDWAEARRRLDLIVPLLDGTRSPRAVIVERARSAGLDASTLYRWARAYSSGLLSSLLPYKPSGGRGKSRLGTGVEEIVKQTISEHFLTRQQRTVRSTSIGSGAPLPRSAAACEERFCPGRSRLIFSLPRKREPSLRKNQRSLSTFPRIAAFLQKDLRNAVGDIFRRKKLGKLLADDLVIGVAEHSSLRAMAATLHNDFNKRLVR
jgi:hypothetical protein